jgi:tetratricopeptide (TPR) repeat protein
VDKNKSLETEKALNLALKNHQEGKTDIALEFYNQVLMIDPDHLQTLNNMGVIFSNSQEIKKAKDCYQKIIEINPNYSEAHNNLGIIFKKLGENQKAKSCHDKAIEINPNYADAHNNLGILFKELEECQKAKECYEKAIEIDPNYANAHNNLGIIFKELNDYQKAKECYEKAIQINPNYANAHNNLGIIFKELNDYQKAKEYYEKAIQINPNHSQAHNNLGNTYKELNDYQKAKECCEKAIEIDPNYANAHNNLGIIFKELNDYQKAKECFEKVIEIDPNNEKSINLLQVLLSQRRFDYEFSDDINKLKDLFMFLFKNNNLKHSDISTNAKRLLLNDNEQKQLEEVINLGTLLDNEVSQNLIKKELFLLMIQKAIIPDEFLEKLLTRIRCEILFNLEISSKHNLNEHFNFIISLAEQCWLNEYVYSESEKEIDLLNKLKNKIEKNKDINELEIAILCCYMPLKNSKNITEKLLVYKSTNTLFNDLISVQIKEPLKEKELAKSIPLFGLIDNIVSKEVRQQYEENPYPRWKFTNKLSPSNFFKWLNPEIKPNKIDYSNKFNNPNVLIAGCGTGSHPIAATRYENANILAIDLSLSSLAYAKRKTVELDHKNIEFLQADILKLNKLNKKFDIIESSGTLHHMLDPIAGLKVLVDLLEPHGCLKLGLYSELARQHVNKAKELIKMKNLKNTNENIKNFRQDIIKKKVSPLIQKAIQSGDFYYTSGARDMLFHTQEHLFTIPKISKILKDFNLEFLGFYLDDHPKKEFSKNFPIDKKNTSLENWHQFEINNPDIFISMYQFWVRKL